MQARSRRARRHKWIQKTHAKEVLKRATVDSMGRDLAEALDGIGAKCDDMAINYITGFVANTYVVNEYNLVDKRIKVQFKDGSICFWVEYYREWAYSGRNYITTT